MLLRPQKSQPIWQMKCIIAKKKKLDNFGDTQGYCRQWIPAFAVRKILLKEWLHGNFSDLLVKSMDFEEACNLKLTMVSVLKILSFVKPSYLFCHENEDSTPQNTLKRLKPLPLVTWLNCMSYVLLQLSYKVPKIGTMWVCHQTSCEQELLFNPNIVLGRCKYPVCLLQDPDQIDDHFCTTVIE